MTAYISGRIVSSLGTVIVLVVVTFLLVRLLPGDVIDVITDGNYTVASKAALESRLGLDEPVGVALGHYLQRLSTANLGNSLVSGRSVRSAIAQHLTASGELAILALALSTTVGVVSGLIAAVYHGRLTDSIIRVLVVCFLSAPSFWIATVVLVYGAIWFSWGPPQQYMSLWSAPGRNVEQLLLPAAILGLELCAPISRMTRTMMLEELRRDYMRTALAKGLTERKTVLSHGLRNALIPVVTIFGVQVSALIGGTVVLEQIFGIPGIGRLLLDAISNRDYPMIQGIVLVVGIFITVINFVIDLLYAVIDPRVRLTGGSR